METSLRESSQAYRFILIWLGQSISAIGSGMTGFALGVWLFEETGMATPFTLVALVSILPRIIFSTTGGKLADRTSRRILMILADSGAALTTLGLVVLWHWGYLSILWVLLFTFLNAVFNSIQIPAYHASVSKWGSSLGLQKSNGLIQFGQAAADILTPLIAGWLLLKTSLSVIFIFDGGSFLFAVLMILLFAPNEPWKTQPCEKFSFEKKPKIPAFRLLNDFPKLKYWFFFMAALMVFWGLFSVLVSPLIISFAGANGLGAVFSIAGVGLLCGSLVFMRLPQVKNPVRLLLWMEAISAFAFFLMGFRPHIAWVIFGAFIAHFSLAIIQSGNRMLWQTSIPEGDQGKAFGVLETGMNAARLFGVMIAGPIVDYLFSPLFLKWDWISGIVGGNVELNRGIAFFVLIIALGKLGLSLSGVLNKKLTASKP